METRQTHSPEGKAGSEGPQQQTSFQASYSPPPAADLFAASFRSSSRTGGSGVPSAGICVGRHCRPEPHVAGVWRVRRRAARAAHRQGTGIASFKFIPCSSVSSLRSSPRTVPQGHLHGREAALAVTRHCRGDEQN